VSDKFDKTQPTLSRRHLLLGAAGVVGAAIMPGEAKAASTGSAAQAAKASIGSPTAATSVTGTLELSDSHAFYGKEEQAGIRTVRQPYLSYMTLDLTTTRREDLQVLLARWSAAIAQMMAGRASGAVEPARANEAGPDTGEALDLGPAALTVTVGLGVKVFSATYGLDHQKPPRMRELVQLPSDALRPEVTGGDLSLQACANDPQVAYHAIRELARIAKETGAASTRWMVSGFVGAAKVTARNLLGYRDGTRNIDTVEDFDRFVWTKEGPAWQRYGTYQVVRKIQMHIENWDTDRISDQNNIFGRHKVSGAPLTGTTEFDTPDFHKKDADGNLVIPATSHIRLAAHENNGGVKILRRPYNYTEGINSVGLLEAGLFFAAYMNDPAHFEMLQTKLGASDALNEYISHVGSAIFFVPPAPAEGSYIGQAMFA
jgi:deferrochelatase/peroxidase EfeB